MSGYPQLRIEVTDSKEEVHVFSSTGLHEDYEFDANIYTGELIVSRVAYGPRGTDEWARTGSVVVAAWPDGDWKCVTQYK